MAGQGSAHPSPQPALYLPSFHCEHSFCAWAPEAQGELSAEGIP